jgi:membrane protein
VRGGETLREYARLARLGSRNVLRALMAEDLRLRAMALTSITLFALVPALVVAFSFFQAFAGMDKLWVRAQDLLIANLAVGARATIEPYLARFVQNAHATSAGVVGAAILLASAVTLLGNVERAVNELWAVRRTRPLVQRALIYWAVLSFGPLLLAGSLALASQVKGHVSGTLAVWLGRGGSLALTCAFFAVVYALVPATRVRPVAAISGGVLAGIAWELAKGLYTWALTRFFDYSAIYGSVAAVPIFLLWLYISWTLLLFGARVAFVVQYARQLVRAHAPEATPLGRELLAARALLEVARAHHLGRPPPDPGEVAAALQAVVEPTREVIAQLRNAGLVVDTATGGLVPARPSDQITLAHVREVLSGGSPRSEGEPAEALVASLLAGAERDAARALAAVTFAELCRRLDPPKPMEPLPISEPCATLRPVLGEPPP